MARVGLLIRPDLCIGCRACQVACKSWNQLPVEKTRNYGTHENPPDLSANLFNRIRFIELPTNGLGVKWLFVSQRCMHCGEPACMEVCPVKAISKTEDGMVLYDKGKCIACHACKEACPFQIPRYDDSGKGKIAKCHFCFDRVRAGLAPACAKTCPTEAIKFGKRDELILLAKKKGYPFIYGEKELGGLGVIFALKEPPSVYKLSERPKMPDHVAFWLSTLRLVFGKRGDRFIRYFV